MSFEGKESGQFNPPTYKIDISSSWDTESEAELFIEGLKKIGIYKEGLLFSGFDGSKIGQQWYSKTKNIVYCSNEENLSGRSSEDNENDDGDQSQNAFKFALDYKKPAIAIYDPAKMQKTDIPYAYKMTDKFALLAVCLLK